MMVSGILVVCRPEHLDATIASVKAFEWAEVHHVQADGRFVATIEAEGADGSMDRLRQLQSFPGVILAEMATYYNEEPNDEGETDVPVQA